MDDRICNFPVVMYTFTTFSGFFFPGHKSFGIRSYNFWCFRRIRRPRYNIFLIVLQVFTQLQKMRYIRVSCARHSAETRHVSPRERDIFIVCLKCAGRYRTIIGSVRKK